MPVSISPGAGEGGAGGALGGWGAQLDTKINMPNRQLMVTSLDFRMAPPFTFSLTDLIDYFTMKAT
jgi:hypothetical protein